MVQNKTKYIFLDRDGVINKDREDFVRKWDEFEFVPGVINSIKTLNDMGFNIIIASNQSGIARGFLTEKDLEIIHRKMIEKIEKYGGKILDIFYCPHHPEGKIKRYEKNCECRKPKPGMLFKAARLYNIDLSKAWMIGDEDRDIYAGRNAGCRTIKVERNKGLDPVIKILSD